ncbi:hypothetical protein [Desertibaculum subflavum]|uniref:hypothetical protein n=1 Tax=Desertibaculum subflavum TaxID=2268458 RepID=UPI0013C52F11
MIRWAIRHLSLAMAGADVSSGRRAALLLPLALALGACGKMGDNEAPPGADPARSKDVFKKPR